MQLKEKARQLLMDTLMGDYEKLPFHTERFDGVLQAADWYIERHYQTGVEVRIVVTPNLCGVPSVEHVDIHRTEPGL